MLGAVFCNVASAQTNTANSPTESVLVATVNIGNAKIVSQNDRDFVISFDISNRVGAQPQIRYAVQLTTFSSTSENLADSKVYNETISIGENSTVSRQISYAVPKSLPAGNYHLWVISKNESGLPLANVPLGEISIKGAATNTVQILSDSCKMSVSTSTTPVAENSLAFNVSCRVASSFPNEINLIPNFISRKTSAFGDIVSTVGGSKNPIAVKFGTGTISVELPKGLTPQRYYIDFSLVAPDGSMQTNTVGFSYILPGMSGMLENVTLDKTSYKAGDTANVQLLVRTDFSSTTVVVSISDGSGKSCSDTISDTIKKSSDKFFTVSVPIAKDCNNPTASVILSAVDVGGNMITLDQRNFQITTPQKDISTQTSMQTSTQTSIQTIVIISIAVLLFIVIILLVKKRNSSVIKAILIVFLGGSAMFCFAIKASADTLALALNYTYYVASPFFFLCREDDKPAYTDYLRVTINKNIFNSNEKMGINAYAEYGTANQNAISYAQGGRLERRWNDYCASHAPSQSLGISFDGVNYIAVSGSYQSNAYSWTYPYQEFSLPPSSLTSVATHMMTIKIEESLSNRFTPMKETSYGLFQFIINPPGAHISIDIKANGTNPTTITSGSSANVSWTSTGATACTLNTVSTFILLPIVTPVTLPNGTNTSGSVSSGNLTSGITYAVTCTNAGNSQTQSVPISILPKAPAPASPSATPGSGTNCGKITINWSAVTGTNIYYKVYRDGQAIANIPSTSITLGSNTSPHTYYVTAYSSTLGESDQSNSVSATAVACSQTNGGQGASTCMPPSQPGNSAGDTNIYINRQTVLQMTNTVKSPLTSVTWNGTNIPPVPPAPPTVTLGNTLNKIYTTVGLKRVSASANVNGQISTCPEITFTAKLATSTTKGI